MQFPVTLKKKLFLFQFHINDIEENLLIHFVENRNFEVWFVSGFVRVYICTLRSTVSRNLCITLNK